METRFLVDRGEVAGLTIDDLDVDRYTLDDDTSPEEVLIAARELQLSGVTNRSWQGLHLINTRGCGLVLAPAGRVLESQRPDYRTVALERPELYFSPTLSGYAIANSASSERECDEPHQYAGKNGVQMNSFVRRAAFALAFLDYNVLGSGAITKDSQMLWVRGVSDRLEKLAPFLSYDTDPYPVAVNGRGHVGGRRLHHVHPLPVRRADRRRATQAAVRPGRQRQLRPQQRQGRRRRLLR